MKICTVGLGYVGLPLSLQFARCGATVLGLDIDRTKVDALNQGRSYIKHIPPESIKTAVDNGSFSASTDFTRVQEVEAVIIAKLRPHLIATNHASVNYRELAEWSPCIVDTRNAMAGIPTKPEQVGKA